MRNILLCVLTLFSVLICSCATSTPPPFTPEVVSVYSTSAAEPWLSELYTCAGTSSVLARVDDASAADISLRVGEPQVVSGAAFQIDSEEILVVTHRQSTIQNLTLEEVGTLFAQGDANATVQVWVYASDADVQQVFDQLVMAGRSVTPSARIAVNPQQMSDTLVNESNAVGILPRHWKAGDVREVFSLGSVPVLALTKSEPQGVIKQLIGCLQK